MEKTIHIDGKPVRFKATGGTPRKYRNQFGEDFFAALMKLSPLTEAMDQKTEEGEANFNDMSVDQLNALNFEVFENVIWVMSKTADPTIPEPEEWLERFEDGLPVFDIFPQLQELMFASFAGNQSKKNHPALKRSR